MIKVLIACEESQRVCTAFREREIEAYSCDIIECSGGHPEWHIQGDVLPLLNGDCEFDTMDGKHHKFVLDTRISPCQWSECDFKTTTWEITKQEENGGLIGNMVTYAVDDEKIDNKKIIERGIEEINGFQDDKARRVQVGDKDWWYSYKEANF